MGGDVRLTVAGIKSRLDEALSRYNDHQRAGDDMAHAGKDLAAVVSQIVKPAPCGIPRKRVLQEKQQDGFIVDLATGQAVPIDGYSDEP